MSIMTERGLSLVQVMRAVGLEDEKLVDRKQMAQLLILASHPDRQDPSNRAKRYTLIEIVGALNAIELLKEQTSHNEGKLKMNTTALKKVCARLWNDYGISYPLTRSVLEWDLPLKRFVFRFDGFLIDAKSGQAQIEAVHQLLGGAAGPENVFADACIDLAAERRLPQPPIILAEARGITHDRSIAIVF